MEPRQVKWFLNVVRECSAQLEKSYDDHAVTSMVHGTAAHVNLSSSVMVCLLRLGAASDLLASELKAPGEP